MIAEKEEIRKLAEREALLRKIIEASASFFQPEELKRTMVKKIGQTLEACRCIIFDYDVESGHLLPAEFEYLASPDIPSARGFECEKEAPELSNAVLEKQPIIVSDMDQFLIQSNLTGTKTENYFKKLKVKAGFSSPITHGDSFYGVLVLHGTKGAITYTSKEIDFVKALSEQLGLALNHAEQHVKLRKQAEREALLRKINDTVRSSLDIEKIQKSFVNEVGKTFKADRCFLRIYDSSENHLPITAEYLSSPDIKSVMDYNTEGEFQLSAKTRFKTGATLIFPDTSLATTDPNLQECFKTFFKKRDVKSNYGIPIFDNNKLLGAFVVQYTKKITILSQDDINLLELIANQTAIALKQARLYTEAQDALKVKSAFLANMSHEFRTPLNAIIGFSDLLLSNNELSPEKLKKYLTNILTSGRHLLNLVNDLLDMSKIEAGKLELVYENIDPKTIIQELVDGMSTSLEGKNIDIDLQLENISIYADPLRFKQIMYNLLSNAIKFTPELGKITVKTELHKDMLVTTVKDTGIGIAQKDFHKIFKEFTQLDSSYTRTQEGTGLGLALSKKLVEMHGGTINFESQEGVGSRFWFTLPDFCTNIK